MVTSSSRRTPHWRVLLTRRVFYHSFNTFSVCCNDFLACCWVLVARCLNLVCCYNTLRRVLLEKQHTDVAWLQKAKFLEHVSMSYKHVCVLKQHANTSRFLVYLSATLEYKPRIDLAFPDQLCAESLFVEIESVKGLPIKW